MTDRRILFHKLLCEILSCPIEGEQCRCYFQPPESIKMNYPAIVYSLDDVDKTYANDGVYLSNRRYAVTVIDKDPDTSLVQKVTNLPMSRFDRHFKKDNLNHYIFNVLYPIQTGGQYNKGVAWNGLSAVTESPSGAEPSPIYADNIKYLNLMSAEDFGGTIEAYTSPDEFAECDGSVEVAPGVFAGQQSRKQFGLSYRTILGNDVDSNDYGYKLHLVYNCLASVSEKGYTTVNDSPEAIALSWEFSTTPAEIAKIIDGKKLKPTAILTLDSTKIDAKKLAALEEILYGKDPTTPEGNDGVDPRLPFPDEVIELLAAEDLP